MNTYKASDRDNRPWGYWETLLVGPSTCVKKIVVRPQHKLSLQSHQHRDELWIVISGTASVVLDDRTLTNLTRHAEIRIAKTHQHRLINPSATEELVILEIQQGEHLDEADITRYADDYNRR
jgi:mannose-1-phosphate guanylyltransferase/mannose-6-phosphate isomerase